jgi:hypothetical protein
VTRNRTTYGAEPLDGLCVSATQKGERNYAEQAEAAAGAAEACEPAAVTDSIHDEAGAARWGRVRRLRVQRVRTVALGIRFVIPGADARIDPNQPLGTPLRPGCCFLPWSQKAPQRV